MVNYFTISDYALLPQDAFRYISEAHNKTSWIDHVVSSFAMHQTMFNMEVLTEFIFFNLRAVAFTIECPTLPKFDDEVIEPQPYRIN